MSKRLFDDTDEATEKVLIELTRQMPDWKKFQQIDSLTNACRQMTLNGIKSRYPDADETEIRKKFAGLLYKCENLITSGD
ncbi:MAG: hypothetical protein AB1757_22490 [Acidobacteriota bacterium]